MAKRSAKEITDAPSAVARITRLDDLIGQAPARRILEAALASGRVHHAWIFHGPVGVGKFTAAYAFAAAMLDPTTVARKGGGAGPDADSAVQRLCRAGSHPDLHVIAKEMAAISRDPKIRESKQTSIAKQVLDEFLIEPASRTRVVHGESLIGKVFIVDEAEMITPAVQNILLKTMEEPPAGTSIILVTSNEDRLLPTIRSRCQRVAFAPLDEREMEAWLKSDPASAGLDAKRRAWVVVFAGGSPGLARLAVTNDLYQWHEVLAPLLASIDKGQFAPELGTTMAKLIAERAEADVKANPEASKDAANKAWARRLLAFVAEHYRARLRSGAAGPSDPDDAATHRWLAAIESVHAAENHLAYNVNLGMLLENLAAQLSLEPVSA